MANCTVSGTFLDASNTAINGATVSFTIEQPVLDASARLLLPKTISTTTASDGSWSLSLAQSISGIITLLSAINSTSPTSDYNFSVIIPATTTATFQSVWADANNLTPVGNLPVSFASISGSLATSQLPALPSADIWVGNGSGAAAAVAVSGDISLANTGAVTVATVGGSTAANINTATATVNTAQSGNKVLASPSNGSSAAPAFRALVGADLPNPSTSTLGGIQAVTAVSGQWVHAISTAGVPSLTTPTFNDISGTVTSSQLPNLTLTGDSTATLVNGTGAVTAVSVGGSTATLIHAAELLANAATNANTASAIVKRDGSGNFTAGTITAALTGTASGNLQATASNHGVLISGAANTATVIAPDASASKLLKSGGSSADPSWLAYTDANTASTIVARDASGNFTAGTITAALTGTASANLKATANNHGVLISGSSVTATVIAPDASTTKALISGGSSADPSWGTLAIGGGGTGQVTKAAAFDALSPMTTGGDLIYGGASGTATRLANGNSGQFLKSNGTTTAPTWAAATVAYTAPTIQKFTSGSGTYTTAASTLYIRVRMVGGGGGGGGGGSSAGTGGTGGNSTFGTTLLVSNGGVGGGAAGNPGGAGGTGSLGSGPIGTAIQGGSGSGNGVVTIATVAMGGGCGAASPLGGEGGGGVEAAAGLAAIANSGSGGGGGGFSGAGTLFSGSGGGAGGWVDALIASPSATYSYAIGAAGAAGTLGTNGFAGGAGGSGYIEVTEYYQ